MRVFAWLVSTAKSAGMTVAPVIAEMAFVRGQSAARFAKSTAAQVLDYAGREA